MRPSRRCGRAGRRRAQGGLLLTESEERYSGGRYLAGFLRERERATGWAGRGKTCLSSPREGVSARRTCAGWLRRHRPDVRYRGGRFPSPTGWIKKWPGGAPSRIVVLEKLRPSNRPIRGVRIPYCGDRGGQRGSCDRGSCTGGRPPASRRWQSRPSPKRLGGCERSGGPHARFPKRLGESGKGAIKGVRRLSSRRRWSAGREGCSTLSARRRASSGPPELTRQACAVQSGFRRGPWLSATACAGSANGSRAARQSGLARFRRRPRRGGILQVESCRLQAGAAVRKARRVSGRRIAVKMPSADEFIAGIGAALPEDRMVGAVSGSRSPACR